MDNRDNLRLWVEDKHRNQIIKNTTVPYFKHLLNVANGADGKVPLGYEIGLCHDLLEDTDVIKEELKKELIAFGYNENEIATIIQSVTELTDVFTKEEFSYLNKCKRKKLEARRLVTISAAAQTVKYADLNDNISWMEVHDPKHLKKYLIKKLALIKGMEKGNSDLRQQVIYRIEKLLAKKSY